MGIKKVKVIDGAVKKSPFNHKPRILRRLEVEKVYEDSEVEKLLGGLGQNT